MSWGARTTQTFQEGRYLSSQPCVSRASWAARPKVAADGRLAYSVSTVNKAQAELEHFTLGGALTFHLIESRPSCSLRVREGSPLTAQLQVCSSWPTPAYPV